MRYIYLQQNSQEWLDFRSDKITGTTAKNIKPKSRGEDRTPAGFWKLLASKLAMRPDGEAADDRGHRLEPTAIQEFSKLSGLPMRTECGVWLDDSNDSIMFSPDGEEPVEEPTYSAEVKALSSDKHIKFIFMDIMAKKQDGYNPIYSVPDSWEDRALYRDQAIQAFVVNDKLQTHYFILYDDRVAFEQLRLYVIPIKRSDVQELVDKAKETQAKAWLDVRKTIAFLIRELKIEV